MASKESRVPCQGPKALLETAPSTVLLTVDAAFPGKLTTLSSHKQKTLRVVEYGSLPPIAGFEVWALRFYRV